ncbi:MAG TPA: hypothetical protein PKI67_10010, partial [bacterium]|nr:hypothetical protein [bacterium]
ILLLLQTRLIMAQATVSDAQILADVRRSRPDAATVKVVGSSWSFYKDKGYLYNNRAEKTVDLTTTKNSDGVSFSMRGAAVYESSGPGQPYMYSRLFVFESSVTMIGGPNYSVTDLQKIAYETARRDILRWFSNPQSIARVYEIKVPENHDLRMSALDHMSFRVQQTVLRVDNTNTVHKEVHEDVLTFRKNKDGWFVTSPLTYAKKKTSLGSMKPGTRVLSSVPSLQDVGLDRLYGDSKDDFFKDGVDQGEKSPTAKDIFSRNKSQNDPSGGITIPKKKDDGESVTDLPEDTQVRNDIMSRDADVAAVSFIGNWNTRKTKEGGGVNLAGRMVVLKKKNQNSDKFVVVYNKDNGLWKLKAVEKSPQ